MEKDDTIGRWSLEKLDLLRKYLQAYVTVLKKQGFIKGYEYIDGFAGTGRPKARDEQRYVEGSPRVALGLSTPFTRYHFIEISDWRIKKIEAMKRDFPDREIEIYQGDCNEMLCGRIIPSLSYSSYKRAIAFLDPFGMSLEWDTLKTIASTKTIEVFVNFPVMDINRNVRRKDESRIPEESRERMDRFWGPGWEGEIFEVQRDLFDEEKTVLKPQSAKDLGYRYQRRLLEIFKYCTIPVVLRNSINAPLYCLIFAGHNETGKNIAEDIFGKFERMG
jgi:three-Cys-motif partner protein